MTNSKDLEMYEFLDELESFLRGTIMEERYKLFIEYIIEYQSNH